LILVPSFARVYLGCENSRRCIMLIEYIGVTGAVLLLIVILGGLVIWIRIKTTYEHGPNDGTKNYEYNPDPPKKEIIQKIPDEFWDFFAKLAI